MAKIIDRRIPLDGEDDFLDVHLVIERRSVIGFSLNYTSVIGGEHRVVCRYDTCHGHLHVHRNWLDRGEPEDLEDPAAGKSTYNEKLTLAERDLQENWRDYRAKMELKMARPPDRPETIE